jgi:hypothetical protein
MAPVRQNIQKIKNKIKINKKKTTIFSPMKKK